VQELRHALPSQASELEGEENNELCCCVGKGNQFSEPVRFSKTLLDQVTTVKMDYSYGQVVPKNLVLAAMSLLQPNLRYLRFQVMAVIGSVKLTEFNQELRKRKKKVSRKKLEHDRKTSAHFIEPKTSTISCTDTS